MFWLFKELWVSGCGFHRHFLLCFLFMFIRRRHVPWHLPRIFAHGFPQPRKAEKKEFALPTLLQVVLQESREGENTWKMQLSKHSPQLDFNERWPWGGAWCCWINSAITVYYTVSLCIFCSFLCVFHRESYKKCINK